ncbi:MAG TPA: cytochrome-c peroxidase, partial [Candidatus Marinimicrobia bacterium]|nr:cytochrome-c peroxidase [Candidatus Neomarinimicrobiota bacterium]
MTEKKQAGLKRVGQRIYVQPGQSIQDGIDQAQPGDSVMVELGIYHEMLAIDKSDITIMGVERNGRLPI